MNTFICELGQKKNKVHSNTLSSRLCKYFLHKNYLIPIKRTSECSGLCLDIQAVLFVFSFGYVHCDPQGSLHLDTDY